MGPRLQCYIPSHKVIGPLVLEMKAFEGFLPYMGVAAILVMCPRPREQTFVRPSHWGSTWNLASIGPAVLEKKIFENGGRTDNGRQQTDDRASLYYKLTNEPIGSGELKMNSKSLEYEDVLYFDLQPHGAHGKYPGVSSYGMKADPPRFLYLKDECFLMTDWCDLDISLIMKNSKSVTLTLRSVRRWEWNSIKF